MAQPAPDLSEQHALSLSGPWVVTQANCISELSEYPGFDKCVLVKPIASSGNVSDRGPLEVMPEPEVPKLPHTNIMGHRSTISVSNMR